MEDIAWFKNIACKAIDGAATELNQLSQQIWTNPELCYKEQKAHKLLTDYLAGKSFVVEPSYKIPTAFLAHPSEFGPSTNGPNIAILCEYDALPEIGHGCGHNLIAEVGIGASLGIQAALKASGKPLGKLTVLGTPAEEAGGGKCDLLKAGAFEGLDVAMMAHPYNMSAASPITLAMTEAYVTYKGKASHAAGFPWEGVNALDAAVMAYTSISVMRQQCKPSWRIHGIITNGGVKPNIIPEESKLHYYLRTPTTGELELLIKKSKACFESAALATGCGVDIGWDPKPYANLLSNKTLASLYHNNSCKLGVEFCKDQATLENPTGSTDMGNVSHFVPSIHPDFYITPESAHTHEFREAAGSPAAQPATLTTAKALAMTALDIYCQPHLLADIQANFKADVAGSNAQ